MSTAPAPKSKSRTKKVSLAKQLLVPLLTTALVGSTPWWGTVFADPAPTKAQDREQAIVGDGNSQTKIGVSKDATVHNATAGGHAINATGSANVIQGNSGTTTLNSGGNAELKGNDNNVIQGTGGNATINNDRSSQKGDSNNNQVIHGNGNVQIAPSTTNIYTGVPPPPPAGQIPAIQSLMSQPTVLGVVAAVHCKPKGGRVSGDFSTSSAPSGTKFLQFAVVQKDAMEDRISFKIRKDRKNFWDEDWIQGVRNKRVFNYQSHTKVFVDSPDGAAGEGFTVYVIAHSARPPQ